MNFHSETEASAIYYAKNGTLNLKNWNHAENRKIKLNGEWIYYPNALKHDLSQEPLSLLKIVPHFWENDPDLHNSPYGFGAYKLVVTGLMPSNIYGFEILDEVTAYNLYANDRLIASNGIVGQQRHIYMPQWTPKQGVFQTDEKGNIEFIIEIANYDYYRGGFWNSITIGDEEAIISDGYKAKLVEMFLFSSILIVAIQNLFLYFLYKRDRSTLYFALFCFCMSFRIILIGNRIISDLIPTLNWYLIVRIEYLLGYMLLPLFGLFAVSLYNQFPHKHFINTALKIFSALNFILILMPIPVFTAFLKPYKWISIFLILYFWFYIANSFKEKAMEAKYMIFSMIGIIISLIKEVFIGGTVSWIPFATLNLIFCFSLITLQRFLKTLKESKELETKVTLDPLTGLYNRFYIKEVSKKLEREFIKENMYILFLDLDCFKEINDNYGHKIGDHILHETGQRIKRNLNSSDIVCRYGGDEFIIFVNGSIYEIKDVAGRIIHAINEPYVIREKSYNIGISIGIAEMDLNKDNIEIVIRKSDEAMYQAKRNGGNHYYIWKDEKMTQTQLRV